MKKKFVQALAEVSIEKHQVEMVNLKDQVAAVHEVPPQELARKAAALLAGGMASLTVLEPYEPTSLTFQGPILILGGGVSGFIAAQELARKGMESFLFAKALTAERVLDELHWTFPGCQMLAKP
jgi:heterodisulfide reductase subunit A-like polyferredoxin